MLDSSTATSGAGFSALLQIADTFHFLLAQSPVQNGNRKYREKNEALHDFFKKYSRELALFYVALRSLRVGQQDKTEDFERVEAKFFFHDLSDYNCHPALQHQNIFYIIGHFYCSLKNKIF